ncbi:MAG: helix-turn-helix transcriptional regulator [Thermaurantimonas sp.]|uniref:helix-turn-helix transcriptional regulator n=1 Tax=Thermaurantimonas sp. TaxID=2681568 RepID=UPI00391947C7
MADTYPAFKRQQKIIEILRHPFHEYSVDEVVEQINTWLTRNGYQPITRRTFYNDIEEIENSGEIVLDKIRKGRRIIYKITSPDIQEFDSWTRHLSERDKELFRLYFSTLGDYKAIIDPDIFEKLTALTELREERVAKQYNKITYDLNVDYHNVKLIPRIVYSVLKGLTVHVLYAPFTDEKQHFEFHPWHMRHFNSRWFVFGKAMHRPELKVMNLAVDRIESYELTTKEAMPNTEIDFTEYFEDIVGVTRPEGATPEKIRIWVDKNVLPYIRTKPMHQSQKIIQKSENENGAEIQLQVIINQELKNLLLSFGGQIEVLSPEHLRQTMMLESMKMLNRYTKIPENSRS